MQSAVHTEQGEQGRRGYPRLHDPCHHQGMQSWCTLRLCTVHGNLLKYQGTVCP